MYVCVCVHVCLHAGFCVCVFNAQIISVRLKVEGLLSRSKYLATSVFIYVWFWNAWYNISKIVCSPF